MSNIYNQAQLSAPVWVINKRLNHHTRERIDDTDIIILEDLSYKKMSGRVHRIGNKDFPYLRTKNVEIGQAVFAGAKSGEGSRLNTPIQNTITLDLMLVCDTEIGLVSDGEGSIGAIDWMARVCDAMETDENNLADASLEGTLSQPISFSIREPETTSAGYEVIIEVTLFVSPTCRGERHYTVPTP